MITEVTQCKKKFNDSINKGLIPTLEEIIGSHEVAPLIKGWYENITNLNFLPEFTSELEEISVFSPTKIVMKSGSNREGFDSDLTWEDLISSMEFIALKNKINWTPLTPFVSFFAQIRNRKVRISLIHGSTNQAGKPKMYIRFLSEKIYPLKPLDELDWSQIVRGKKNILISGATGSGKTTFLNSLLELVNPKEHIAIIEDTFEIVTKSSRVTRFLTNTDQLSHGILDYIKYSMRISPDRIIVGELRSIEIEALIMAINSGHNGVLSSIHANDAKSAVEKCALLFQLYSKHSLAYNLVLKLVANNLDYVVHMENKEVKEVIQVFGSEDNQLFYEKIF